MNLKQNQHSRKYRYYSAGLGAARQRRSLSKRSAATRPADYLTFSIMVFFIFIVGFGAGMVYADIAWIDILNSADLETICGPN